MLYKERLLKFKSACSRSIQTPALISYARGASPSMRERRVNRPLRCLISAWNANPERPNGDPYITFTKAFPEANYNRNRQNTEVKGRLSYESPAY
jgi:hypothetical protein